MTGSEVVLDTNVVIDFLDEEPDTVTAVGNLSKIFLPSIVLGELYVGIYRSTPQLKQKKTDKIENFIRTATLLRLDESSAKLYAQIKAMLFGKGRPIPENDIWIAAATMQHGLPIYTFDGHFKEVDGLTLFNPLSSI